MIKIFMMNGPDAGRVFTATKDMIFIGRSSGSDIRIEDRSVSRKHLRISRKLGAYYIQDFNSANGTFIGSKRITAFKEIKVEKGIPITAGNIIFSLEMPHSVKAFPNRGDRDASKGLLETGNGHRTAQKKLELFYEVSGLLRDPGDLTETLQKILSTLFDYFQTLERALIILIRRESGEVYDVIPRSGEDRHRTLAYYSHAVVDRVVQERGPVIMPDTDSEKEPALLKSLRSLEIRSVMAVPLTSRSQFLGVIYLDSQASAFRFAEEDLSFLTALSGPAAFAIDNALLTSELERFRHPHGKSVLKAQNHELPRRKAAGYQGSTPQEPVHQLGASAPVLSWKEP